MGYTLELIEQIAEHMRGLPEVEKNKIEKTRPEAVKMLAKEIKEMQRKGYTLDQIAGIITERGIEIKTGTLKAYIQRGKGPKPETKPKATKGTKPTKSVDMHQETSPGTHATKKPGTFEVTPDTENL